MILRNFKHKINRFFFNRKIARYSRKATSFNSDTIASVIVLTNDEYNHQVIPLELSELLGVESGKITSVLFKDVAKSGNQHEDDTLSIQDFKWGGKLKKEVAQKYLNVGYDLLINYCNEENLLVNLFSLQCNSKFNIAFNHQNEVLNDLIIHCDKEDLATFNNEVKKYLAIFNKNIV